MLKSITQFSVRYPVSVSMIIIATLLLGYISFGKLGIDLFPDLNNPRLFIELKSGERPPEEIEERFVDRIEALTIRQSGVVNVSSVSRVGVAQIECIPGNVASNCSKIVTYARRALHKGCGALVLPEMVDTGYDISMLNEIASPWDEKREDTPFAAARNAAKETGIYLVCGLSEKVGEKVYNSTAVFDPHDQLFPVLGGHRRRYTVRVYYAARAAEGNTCVGTNAVRRYHVSLIFDCSRPGERLPVSESRERPRRRDLYSKCAVLHQSPAELAEPDVVTDD